MKFDGRARYCYYYYLHKGRGKTENHSLRTADEGGEKKEERLLPSNGHFGACKPRLSTIKIIKSSSHKGIKQIFLMNSPSRGPWAEGGSCRATS